MGAKSLEQFIKEAISIHGNKYNYDKVIYINNRTKIIIICSVHGEFLQTPSHHILGKQGCSSCSGNKRKTTEQFIKEAVSIHGNKYNYDKVIYVKNNKDVIILCPIHNEFLQTPIIHLKSKYGCPQCSKKEVSFERRKTTEQFIEEAVSIHGNRYDYNKVIYTSCDDKVIIACSIHGEFLQTPINHLRSKHGCPQCGYDSSRLLQANSLEQFIEKANSVHGNKYNYDKAIYINNHIKIIIICKIHGEFLQIPSNHIDHKCGCPKCNGGIKKNT